MSQLMKKVTVKVLATKYKLTYHEYNEDIVMVKKELFGKIQDVKQKNKTDVRKLNVDLPKQGWKAPLEQWCKDNGISDGMTEHCVNEVRKQRDASEKK